MYVYSKAVTQGEISIKCHTNIKVNSQNKVKNVIRDIKYHSQLNIHVKLKYTHNHTMKLASRLQQSSDSTYILIKSYGFWFPGV